MDTRGSRDCSQGHGRLDVPKLALDMGEGPEAGDWSRRRLAVGRGQPPASGPSGALEPWSLGPGAPGDRGDHGLQEGSS